MTKDSGERISQKTIARKTGEVEVTTLQLKGGGELVIEEHENGALVIEQARGPDMPTTRTCSGSCGDVGVGPIDCPEGTSPHLDCTKNPPTLKCVKDEWA